jgi:mannan endo-1,4-beta-mannosidase
LKKAVDLWVARAAMMKAYEKHVLVNIANEWGPADSVQWRDSYIEAVARMRSAGYLGTLVIDSGGCGQDPLDIIKYAPAVFESDPQRNILFDVHIYGEWANGKGQSWQIDLKTNLDRLAALKLPIVIGEFGPGRDIGPSPTRMTPGEIITASEERAFGWLAWAWDDPAWGGDDDSFTMSFDRDYNKSSDLTIFGKDVVENPTYGLLKLARPATSF